MSPQDKPPEAFAHPGADGLRGDHLHWERSLSCYLTTEIHMPITLEGIEREAREASVFGGPADIIDIFHARIAEAIAAKNQAYRERNELAACLATMSMDRTMGCSAWRGVDPDDPGWPVLYIELPSSQQVSYHFSPSDAHLISHIRESHWEWEKWDGSTSEDRSRRLASPMEHID